MTDAMGLEEELLQDAEDDRLTVEFVKSYLPQEEKEKITDDLLYNILDVMEDN